MFTGVEKSQLPSLTDLGFEIAVPAKAPGLTLIPGRVLHQPDRDINIERRGEMNYAKREEIVHLHRTDAEQANIGNGDRVSIRVEDGTEVVVGVAALDMPYSGFVAATELFANVATALQDSNDPDPAPAVQGLPLRSVTLVKAPAHQEAEVAAD